MRTTVSGKVQVALCGWSLKKERANGRGAGGLPRGVVFYQKGTEEPWGEGPTSSKSQASIGFVIQKDLI